VSGVIRPSLPGMSAAGAALRGARLVAIAGLPLLLAGCLDWVVPGEHAERGYDGADDSLIDQPVETRAPALQERFDLIQSR